MASFTEALPVILEHEGFDVCTDTPDDKGGTTKWGITAGALERYRKRPCGPEDIRTLTYAEAEACYRATFWDTEGLGCLRSQRVATKCFDILVNMGLHGGARVIQKACVACGSPLEVDGFLGCHTIKALNAAPQDKMLAALKAAQRARYEQIIAADPSQERFRHGWLTRSEWP